MSAWPADDLARIGGSDEIQLASRRADGTLRPFITIWVVRHADCLYVRSAYGPQNPWFVRALASGEGRIRTGDMERDVTFEAPEPGLDADLHAAYHAKYDRHGPRIVGTVVSPEAARSTLRLMRREPSAGRD